MGAAPSGDITSGPASPPMGRNRSSLRPARLPQIAFVDNGPVLRPSEYEPVGFHLSWVLTTVLAIRRLPLAGVPS